MTVSPTDLELTLVITGSTFSPLRTAQLRLMVARTGAQLAHSRLVGV
jgi:hypothetical protein